MHRAGESPAQVRLYSGLKGFDGVTKRTSARLG